LIFGGYDSLHRRQIRSACGGGFDGKLCKYPIGWLFPIVTPGAIFSPHRPQKREFSGSKFEHRGHGKEFGDSPALTRLKERLPQRPQNLTPSAKRELQLEHATIPGIRLECTSLLPLPCDGGLSAGRTVLSWA